MATRARSWKITYVEYGSARWTWTKVGSIHRTDDDVSAGCAGEVYSYRFRVNPPSDGSFDRCVGLAWCSTCREYSAAMVSVPRDERLPDLLAGLSELERERLARSEVKLLDYLDRLARASLLLPS